MFDLDGTLYNKQGLALQMLKRLWWAFPLMAIDRCARGPLWRWVVQTRWYKRVYLPTMVELIATTCQPRQEVLNLIDECRRKGLQMAIYSDYACIPDKLAVLGVNADWFALLADSPSLGARKPSLPSAQRLLSQLNAQPSTTLFIGDRDDTDGATARALNAKYLIV